MAYQESRFNRLDAPVPGESLTSEPKNYNWEHPAQFPKVPDAFDFIWHQMHQEPQLTQLISLLQTGVPVEALAKTLLFAGLKKKQTKMCFLLKWLSLDPFSEPTVRFQIFFFLLTIVI